jgi:uncharacterized membrane protein required for colicin V production
LTKYDLIFLGVVVFFALVGFLRGFIIEFFEALGLVCAVYFGRTIALAIIPHLPTFIPQRFQTPLTTFIFSILIFFSIKALGSALNSILKKSPFKLLNRILGGPMGAIKAVILLIMIMAFLSASKSGQSIVSSAYKSPLFAWTKSAAKPVIRLYSIEPKFARKKLESSIPVSI